MGNVGPRYEERIELRSVFIYGHGLTFRYF